MVGAEEVKPRDLLLVRLDEELPEARVLSFLHALRIIVAAGVSGEDRCIFCRIHARCRIMTAALRIGSAAALLRCAQHDVLEVRVGSEDAYC